VSATLRLDDGRVIAYEDHGVGPAVVCFHGSPGSRLFRPAPSGGIRLVTFDRPGYGRSDPQPGRRLADTAHDVARLADHLGLDRFGVVGWSGGGPFAIATAFHCAHRVTRLAIVSAPGPLDEVPGAWEALGDHRRPTAEMARVDPARSERAIARHMEPYLDDPPGFLGSGAADPMLVAQVHEALRQGATGIAQDLVAMWVEWGFRLADLRVPAHVWHGARDPHNDADTAAYAACIPGARRTVWPDGGHLGVIEHWSEIVAWLTAGEGRGAAPG